MLQLRRMRWPPIINEDTFARAEQALTARAKASGPRERFSRRHVYVLGGCVTCGLCGRKMQAHWANGLAYCRCRFPAEYALANKVEHPRNVFVRERDIVFQQIGAAEALAVLAELNALTIPESEQQNPDLAGPARRGQDRES